MAVLSSLGEATAAIDNGKALIVGARHNGKFRKEDTDPGLLV